jgi:multidrug efflux pump subunit AcrA (membrane-fusion protein)
MKPALTNRVRSTVTSRRFIIIVSLCVLGGGAYYYYHTKTSTTVAATYYTISAVGRGSVSTGISTTGTIKAADKLDLNVYKQQSRIDAVSTENGGHVAAGTTIVSFDKSDALVTSASAKVAVSEAALNLQNEQSTALNPNTTIRTLQSNIAGYIQTIKNAHTDLDTAYRDFLNTNLESVPRSDLTTRLADATPPAISGRYVGTETGSYTIEIYGSAAASGYSYRVSGLETETASIVFGKANPIGTRGLKLTFPNSARAGDVWVILVPNTTIATYSETKQAYDTKVANLNKTIVDTTTLLANAQQNLKDTQSTDTSDYRDLNVDKAQSTLAAANQKLRDAYKVIVDRNIVAPFSGTVEGMENVVAGATPTGGTNDPINLGTLVSDTFLTTFNLSATDVAKVNVGDAVDVAVTSYTKQPHYVAKITHISSLPGTTGVPQYEVQAELNYNHATATDKLREGMLANITVIKDQKDNVVRVPTSAITYKDRKPYVTVVPELTTEQKTSFDKLGIVKSTTAPLGTVDREVTLGIVGSDYAEVTDGLTEGSYIVTTALKDTSASASVVQETGPGPRRTNGNSSGSSSNKNQAPE